MHWFGIASYTIAALVYAGAAITLAVGHRTPRNSRAKLLIAAIAVSGIWAGGTALLFVRNAWPLFPAATLDAVHAFVWTLAVVSWVAPRSAVKWVVPTAGATALWVPVASILAARFPALISTVYAALVAGALIGILAVEQVVRNAKEEQRKSLVLLCVAAAGIFAVDLFVYSQAMLLEGLVSPFWEARGLASAALLPLVLLAMKRQEEWQADLFVSRQVVFYSATFLGVGGYLLTMGLVAYGLRLAGGEWSLALELVFLLGAFAVLAFVLFSARWRARFRVFLVKHFYRNKYDYRDEWLRLTQILGRTADLAQLATNALGGLVQIVGSARGELWIARDPLHYDWMVSSDDVVPSMVSLPSDHAVIAYLRSTGWVIDSEEYARQPDRYGTSFGDPADGLLPPSVIIVPLDCQGYLQGYAVLEKPRHLRSLNFEDHDILKTAGRQVAVVLAQALAQERLAETRQFEAMSKLTTFLMHDLKNIVAQQELVVANAQKFRHRPEFIDDAIRTIKSGVERMRKVLDQLQGTVRASSPGGRVDVTKVLMEVKSHCADRRPVLEMPLAGNPIWVTMDREKLTGVLTHVVRNAQEATPESGRISIELSRRGDYLAVSVSDTGHGMDPAFLRDRLFRPFDTTKGSSGMGIGAYQVRETMRAVGGDIEVESEVGVGTTFCLKIPLAEPVVAIRREQAV